MDWAEEQLATIGFGRAKAEASCWRGERLDCRQDWTAAPQPRSNWPDPACSPALLRWRDLLARDPRPSPYRISRA